jgi:hypothetical protein
MSTVAGFFISSADPLVVLVEKEWDRKEMKRVCRGEKHEMPEREPGK